MHVPASYHTHNTYCDGDASIEAMVEAAIGAGLTEFGVSSHAPLPFECEWTMPPARLRDYVAHVREVADRFRDHITVRLGLEIDYIPSAEVIEYQEREVLPLPLDYLIGSVHFLGHRYPPHSFDDSAEDFQIVLEESYTGDIVAMIADFYRRVRAMVQLPHVTAVGHLDRIKRWNKGNRFFSAGTPEYLAEVERTLDAIAASGKIVEYNTAGWRTVTGDAYPARSILEGCRKRSIPVIVSSDAHAPEHVAWGFERAEALLKSIGIEPVGLVFNPTRT